MGMTNMVASKISRTQANVVTMWQVGCSLLVHTKTQLPFKLGEIVHVPTH